MLGLSATGGNYALARRRIKSMGLDTSHWTGQGWAKGQPARNRRDVHDYLVSDGPFIQSHKLKLKLLDAKLLEYKCSECEILDWNGKPLSLQLDHIDGCNTNNRLDNLRILCPNCHSQTSTFAGRNIGSYS